MIFALFVFLYWDLNVFWNKFRRMGISIILKFQL